MKHKGLLAVVAVLCGVGLLVQACTQPAPAPAPATTPAVTPKPAPAPATSAPASVTTPAAKPAPTPATSSALPKFSLVSSLFSAAGHVMATIPAQEFAKRVSERTNGRIEIRNVLGAALYSDIETLDGVGKGGCDFGALSMLNFVGRLRFGGTLPNIIDPDLGSKLSIPAIVSIEQKLIEEFPEFDKDFTDAGIKRLWLSPADPYVFGLVKPAATIADLKGRKIRGLGTYIPLLVQATGATSVTVSVNEQYTALATGVLDGTFTNPSSQISFKLNEVQKYFFVPGKAPLPIAGCNVIYVVNLNTWNKIPASDQNVMLQIANELSLWNGQQRQDQLAASLKQWQQLGGTVTYASDDEQLAKWQASVDLFKLAANDLDAKGLPGTKFLARYKELARDYISGKWKPQ